MAKYKCSNCGKIFDIEEKKTIFGTLAKWGVYGVVAVIALQFLAIILMACLIVALNSIFESNDGGESKKQCKNCGGSNFAKMDGGY